jgi:hypothetical protein
LRRMEPEHSPASESINVSKPITSTFDAPSAHASALCSSPAVTAPHAKPNSLAPASSPSTGPCPASWNPPRSSPDPLHPAACPERPPSSASPRSWSLDSERPAEYPPAELCSIQWQSPALPTARRACPRERDRSPHAQTHQQLSKATYPPWMPRKSPRVRFALCQLNVWSCNAVGSYATRQFLAKTTT